MTYQEFLGWVIAAGDAANPKRQLKELVKGARQELAALKNRNDAATQVRKNIMCGMGYAELMRGLALHTMGRPDEAVHAIDVSAVGLFEGAK